MQNKMLSFERPVKSPRISAVADVDPPPPAMVRYALVQRELLLVRAVKDNTRELRQLRHAIGIAGGLSQAEIDAIWRRSA